jgi:hypothetical protein
MRLVLILYIVLFFVVLDAHSADDQISTNGGIYNIGTAYGPVQFNPFNECHIVGIDLDAGGYWWTYFTCNGDNQADMVCLNVWDIDPKTNDTYIRTVHCQVL